MKKTIIILAICIFTNVAFMNVFQQNVYGSTDEYLMTSPIL